MKRRAFLKAAVAVPVAAYLPLPTSDAPLLRGDIGMFMGFTFTQSGTGAMPLTAEFVRVFAGNVETLLIARNGQ